MEWRSLPVELQEEILSRVPAKSLTRLRSTSKQWNTLLKTGSFAKKHSANAPKESLVILLIDSRVYVVRANLHGIHNVSPAAPLYLKDPFSNFSQVDIRHIFHCDGLLLCTTRDRRLLVWNPCSGEAFWIKPRNSYKHFDHYALGYHKKSSCKQYKILRVVSQIDVVSPGNRVCEIYDFTSDSWSVVGEITDWFLTRAHNGVSVKGNAYWFACNCKRLLGQYYEILLSFDFSTERFQSLSLPQLYPYFYPALSVVREEQLCVLSYVNNDTNSYDLHVWVTTSIGSVMSWSKFLTVQDVHSSIDKFFYGMSFLADVKNKVVVCCNNWIHNKILHVMGENNHIQHVNPHGRDSTQSQSYCSILMNYVPSLSLIQQATLRGGPKS